ncbi:MAG: methionyl-tRNA formyltransferase [Candidatus Dormibacteria bacterium]
MEVVFAGTSDFAVPALRMLVEAGHGVRLVVTQPDRPKGRGLKVQAPPVKVTADELGLEVYQPEKVRDAEALKQIVGTGARLFVCAAYGQIVPQELLESFPLGGINIHGSLLPRYRGAAPVAAAILNGDRQTGVSIMQMDATLDTGAVLAQATLTIGPRDSAGELTGRLAELGARLLADVLPRIQRREVRGVRQDDSRATHAPKLRREDGVIDWKQPADQVDRLVRALSPWPGTSGEVCGQPVKVIRGRPVDMKGIAAEPGACVKVGPEGMVMATGAGFYLVEEAQMPGKAVVNAASLPVAATKR